MNDVTPATKLMAAIGEAVALIDAGDTTTAKARLESARHEFDDGRMLLPVNSLQNVDVNAADIRVALVDALTKVLEWPNPHGPVEAEYIPPWLAGEARAVLQRAAHEIRTKRKKLGVYDDRF